MMQAAVPTAYRSDVDGLRAVAVVSVVAYHLSARLAPGGFAGVDVFFVISGYLISGIILKALDAGTFSFAEFYSRRIRRIVPALVVVVFAMWAIGWVALLPVEYKSLGRHTAASAAYASNILLWKEVGYFDTGAGLKPLLHLWSLGVEEQFYLLWPLCLFAAWRLKLNILWTIGVLATLSFAWGLFTVAMRPAAAFYLPHTRWWELMLGSALAGMRDPRRDATAIPGADALGIVGLILVGASIVSLRDTQPYPGWGALLPTVGTAMLITAGSHSWINRRVLAQRVFVFVGLIAYPLYLWHWPLISLANILGHGIAYRSAACAAAFVLAWLTTRLVETPIRFGKLATARRRPVVAGGLLLALCGVGLLGFATDRSDGFLGRVPVEARFLQQYQYDFKTAYRVGTCFLSTDQDERSFDPGCARGTSDSQTDLVVLWGDSHAAHLYPGLERLQAPRGFRLAEFASSSCPPLLNVHLAVGLSYSQHCARINDFVVKRLRELNPSTVIIGAHWLLYSDASRQTLADTVVAVRSASAARIVVVGPVPEWHPSLPQALSRVVLRTRTLPSRMTAGLIEGPAKDVDAKLRRQCETLGVAYVSPLDVLCNDGGCLTLAGTGSDTLTAWDYGHLTTAGSTFLFERVAARIP